MFINAVYRGESRHTRGMTRKDGAAWCSLISRDFGPSAASLLNKPYVEAVIRGSSSNPRSRSSESLPTARTSDNSSNNRRSRSSGSPPTARSDNSSSRGLFSDEECDSASETETLLPVDDGFAADEFADDDDCSDNANVQSLSFSAMAPLDTDQGVLCTSRDVFACTFPAVLEAQRIVALTGVTCEDQRFGGDAARPFAAAVLKITSYSSSAYSTKRSVGFSGNHQLNGENHNLLMQLMGCLGGLTADIESHARPNQKKIGELDHGFTGYIPSLNAVAQTVIQHPTQASAGEITMYTAVLSAMCASVLEGIARDVAQHPSTVLPWVTFAIFLLC